jgi:hypothetical protein
LEKSAPMAANFSMLKSTQMAPSSQQMLMVPFQRPHAQESFNEDQVFFTVFGTAVEHVYQCQACPAASASTLTL